MQYCRINGVEVSRIGLGTWAFGGREWGRFSTRDAVRLCLAAVEQGVQLFDTAPVYGRGRAERIVGRAMQEHGCREDFYIATKCGIDWSGGGIRTNSTAARIERELRHSLSRLNTGYIDLYQVHWPDPLVPIEEVADLLAGFLRNGSVRAIGVSNFSVAQMDRFRSRAPIHAAQFPYNLFEPEMERKLLPYCELYGIAVLAWSPLCRGLLGGQLNAATVFPQKDIRSADPKFQPPRFARYLAAVDRLQAFAAQHYDRSVADLAMRWLLDRPGVSAALCGITRPDQLQAALGSQAWNLGIRARAAVEEIVRQTITDYVGLDYLRPSVRHWPEAVDSSGIAGLYPS